MDQRQLKRLLEEVRAGELPVPEALKRLRRWPVDNLGFASIDHHRALRHGFPEVVFAKGKTPEQVAGIVGSLAATSSNLLVTRATADVYEAVKAVAPEASYSPASGCITLQRDRRKKGRGFIAVVSAGTSDIPVAEEAAITASVMGNRVETFYDLGVAGLHRLLMQREKLFEASVLIVVAGMEGALPSVIGGLVSAPVIAVPTSVGYGASFQGLAALLGMLNSCASNVAVVNIDNGFGAGYVASLINRRR
jgi:pyridinium-3,5-biscarboxylic acid mononucleotide synthase